MLVAQFARVAAVEQIEKIDERYHRTSFSQFDDSPHSQVGLDIGGPAELTECCRHSIDGDAPFSIATMDW
jgi:hypothetical protein